MQKELCLPDLQSLHQGRPWLDKGDVNRVGQENLTCLYGNLAAGLRSIAGNVFVVNFPG